MNKTKVYGVGEDAYFAYRIPALAVTRLETLLAFCEARKDGLGDYVDIDAALKRSFDAGRTWGPLQILWDVGTDSLGNLCPIVDRDTGTIWLLVNNKTRNSIFVMKSEDDGESWSHPKEITRSVIPSPAFPECTPNPGHGIQLACGRMFFPARTRQGTHVYAIYSDDHGETWQAGGLMGIGTGESMAVETVDGSLYMTVRHYRLPPGAERGSQRFSGSWTQEQMKQVDWSAEERYAMSAQRKTRWVNRGPWVPRRAYAWSRDRGESWENVQMDPTLIDPLCEASVTRWTREGDQDRNRIVFANPASLERDHLTLRLSCDECRSWNSGQVIHEGPSAYSDLAALPDGTLGCFYECGENSPYERLDFARIHPQWLDDS